jgi:hypothetical protein
MSFLRRSRHAFAPCGAGIRKSLHLRPLLRCEGSDSGLSSSTRKWYSEERLQYAKRAAREWAQAEVGLQNGSWNQTEWDLLLVSEVFIIVAQLKLSFSQLVSSLLPFLAFFGSCCPVFVYDYRRAVPHAAMHELLHEQCSTELPHNQDIKPRIWG